MKELHEHSKKNETKSLFTKAHRVMQVKTNAPPISGTLDEQEQVISNQN
jgi:hypothetical protein